MATAEVIAENEVTISNLTQLFKRAFFKTSLDDDDELVVYSDGPRVRVTLNQNNKLIKFTSVYGFKESARLDLKYAFTNKMNDDIVLGRFSIPNQRQDILVADYYLPFEEGIPAFQIVSAFRFFAQVVTGAIRQCDENNLID